MIDYHIFLIYYEARNSPSLSITNKIVVIAIVVIVLTTLGSSLRVKSLLMT